MKNRYEITGCFLVFQDTRFAIKFETPILTDDLDVARGELKKSHCALGVHLTYNEYGKQD
jgi:hypothetical protein